MHPEVRGYLLQAQAPPPGGDLAATAAFYDSQRVVATTCLGWSHPVLRRRVFDYCIVDEASQLTQAVCLGPLQQARVFVLVGDHYQLPPLVQNDEARAQGMDVSLFKRLCEAHPQAVVTLDHQYRMNQEIMALANAVVYDERLRCGTAGVASGRLDLSDLAAAQALPLPPWLRVALDPASPVVFFDTDSVRLAGPRGA